MAEEPSSQRRRRSRPRSSSASQVKTTPADYKFREKGAVGRVLSLKQEVDIDDDRSRTVSERSRTNTMVSETPTMDSDIINEWANVLIVSDEWATYLGDITPDSPAETSIVAAKSRGLGGSSLAWCCVF